MTPSEETSEKKSSRSYWGFVFWSLVPLCFMCGCSLKRCSERHIHDSLLRDTPVGTGYSQVLEHVKQRGWFQGEVSNGYRPWTEPGAVRTEVGKKTIVAYLGGYRGLPWWKDVHCYYSFDNNDLLLDVFVEKEADAL